MNSKLNRIGICFFLSGLAALLYQTAWMRQLSVVFGTSELAVATVLTAYMSGLSLGAAIAGRLVHRIKRPLLTYGLLEGGIAISAVAVPFLLMAIGDLTALALGNQPYPPESKGIGQLLFYFSATLLILVVPTALMGATLPLLIKHVISRDDEIGSKVGGLYSLNTFGAIAGTLIAAFILLPNISLMSTILVGAGVNLLVLLVIINLSKNDIEISTQSSQVNQEALPKTQKQRWNLEGSAILPIMTASGVATFTYEVLWTRLISHVLGGSVPAFAVMLAGFLIGIAVGSAIASRLAKTAKMARVGFVICQLGIALAAAATFFAINQFTPDKGGLFINSLFSLAVLLPSTLFIGATFPFAVRILAKSANDAPLASARVYAWNTVGAIFGAAFAGYFLIPAAKYEGAIQVAIYLNLLLAVCTVYLIKFESKSLFLKTIPAALVLLFAVFYNPEWPKNIVTFSPFTQAKEPEKENVFYDVGRSSTVLMTAESGFYRLRNNGLPEAAISMKGMPRSWPTYSILSMLPTIARPDAKSMMVAGFGGGVVVEGISPSIEEIDVLELEPKVIEANRLISNLRDIDPLKDPRVNIIYNDARSALNLTTKKYDIIVSQPSHPWTAGASHLYTQEYMQLVEQHLTKNGVFLQWMNTSFTDEFLLRSLAATLVDTFEYVRIYQFTPSVLSFLASNEPIEIERQIVSTGRPFSDHPDYFESRGYYSAEMILAGLAMDTAGVKRFSSTGQIVTDNFNTLGTRSALAIESKKVITVNRVADLILEHSPLFNVDSWVYNDLIDNLKIPYLSSLLPRLGGNDAYSKFHLNLAQRNNYKAFGTLHTILLSQGKIDEAREALISGLKVNKNDNEQKYKLLATYLENDELGQLEPDLEKVLETLGSVPKAVLENLKYLDFSNNEVDKLRAIDDTLAQSKQSDTWYVPALRLRAIWRSRLSKTENNKEIAKEALNLIEIAIANSSDFWILESRLELATLIGDELKVLRSVESMIKVWSQQISIFSQLKEFPENFSFENKKNSLKRAAKTLSNYNCLSDEICDKLSQANETIETYLEAYQQLQLKFASVNNAQN